MGIWEKSLLLILLRRQLEAERTIDWQTLHRRDRRWALAQPEQSPWQLLRSWLQQQSVAHSSSTTLFIYGAGMAAFILGFALMAGLLIYQPFQRINLLWFLLIALFLPFVWWLLALFFSRAQVPFPLRTLYEHRLPQGCVLPPLNALLKQTVMALGQTLSLLFAGGMLLAFLLYLLLTDLAFGWSSTLDLGNDLVHQVTATLAWPWQSLWPDAVPSLALIEQTHYFRAAPLAVEQPAVFGQWWRFLLMSLLVYLLFPRLVTTALARYRLTRMQERVRDNDALISGLWQRLTSELIDQEAEPVVQRESPDQRVATDSASGDYAQILCWGVWPDELLDALRGKLLRDKPQTRWIAVDSASTQDASLAALDGLPDQPLLLLCKGWEPPTGELADLCQSLARVRSQLFLWPVPLPGMSETRQANLIQSWQPFMRQLPDRVHLTGGELPQAVARD